MFSNSNNPKNKVVFSSFEKPWYEKRGYEKRKRKLVQVVSNEYASNMCRKETHRSTREGSSAPRGTTERLGVLDSKKVRASHRDLEGAIRWDVGVQLAVRKVRGPAHRVRSRRSRDDSEWNLVRR